MGPRYAAPPRGPDTAPQPKAFEDADSIRAVATQAMVRRFIAVTLVFTLEGTSTRRLCKFDPPLPCRLFDAEPGDIKGW
jgi:hypothetical protein